MKESINWSSSRPQFIVGGDGEGEPVVAAVAEHGDGGRHIEPKNPKKR